MIPAYLGLGSNLEEPAAQLQRAVDAISALPESRLERVSSLYRSAAVGPGEQPDYLNAVLCLATTLSPLALLDALQAIETAQGRVRTIRWGPRTLDLDILLYGEQSISEPRLRVPHPAMFERNFVLYPLLQLAGPNLVLPDGTELGTLVAQCPLGSLVDTGERLVCHQSRQG